MQQGEDLAAAGDPGQGDELARRARADVGPSGSVELDLADDLEAKIGRAEPEGEDPGGRPSPVVDTSFSFSKTIESSSVG